MTIVDRGGKVKTTKNFKDIFCETTSFKYGGWELNILYSYISPTMTGPISLYMHVF